MDARRGHGVGDGGMNLSSSCRLGLCGMWKFAAVALLSIVLLQSGFAAAGEPLVSPPCLHAV